MGEAPDGREAVRLAKAIAPDLAVVDVGMPNLNGIEATRQIREVSPHTRVLMLSMHGDREYVYQSIRAGAAGYVLKSAAFGELISAIETVLSGGRYSSPQLAAAMKETPVGPGGAAALRRPQNSRARARNPATRRGRQLGPGDRQYARHQRTDGRDASAEHHE